MGFSDYKCGSFDTSEYPIIKAKIHPRRPSSQDIQDYLDALIKILKRTSGNFALYIDATQSSWLGKEGREITYVGMKYIQEEFKDRYKAHYIRTNSFSVRILVKLIYGFSKKKIIQKTFLKEEKALKEIAKDMMEWS